MGIMSLINHNAEKINEKLGVTLFDVNDTYRLKLLKFTKAEIKRLMIDDLIDDKCKGTERLARKIQRGSGQEFKRMALRVVGE